MLIRKKKQMQKYTLKFTAAITQHSLCMKCAGGRGRGRGQLSILRGSRLPDRAPFGAALTAKGLRFSVTYSTSFLPCRLKKKKSALAFQKSLLSRALSPETARPTSPLAWPGLEEFTDSLQMRKSIVQLLASSRTAFPLTQPADTGQMGVTAPAGCLGELRNQRHEGHGDLSRCLLMARSSPWALKSVPPFPLRQHQHCPGINPIQLDGHQDLTDWTVPE